VTWRPLPTSADQREPRPVADSLGRIAASIGAPRPSLLTAVFARWEELVGPDVAAHATPRSLRGGVLTVEVDHPAWATSLRLLSATVLQRIAERGGTDAVRDDGEVTELVVVVSPGPGRARWAGGGKGRRADPPRRRGL
jgi:hypothetical protein